MRWWPSRKQKPHHHTRRLGNFMFKRMNNFLIYFYDGLVDILTATAKRPGAVYVYPELRRMNRMMDRFYHLPMLEITATDNLIPFKFETEDGVILDGLQYISDVDSDKWIIGCHWFAGDKYWSLYWAKPFIELNYNILVFDFRNHGKSQKGQPTTMGLLETYDLLAAMKWLYENHSYKVLGLLGVSMGAYVTNYVQIAYPELMKKYKLKFSISDVGYGSIKSLLLHIRNVRLKKFLGKRIVARKIDNILTNQNELTGFNWYDLDLFRYYEQLRFVPTTPVFFSHGLDDRLTPPTDTLRLYSDRKEYNLGDEILIYNFSNHGYSLKEHFYRQVYHWLMFENKIMKNDALTRKALAAFEINQDHLMNNGQEEAEVYTFYLNPDIAETEIEVTKGVI